MKSRPNKRLAVAYSALCVPLMLSACAGTPEPLVGPVAAIPVESSGQSVFSTQQATEYRLRPSDEIAITVFREPALSVERVPVGSDGLIAIPLVGPVRAEGRTASELGADIAAVLGRGYLVNPQVAVNIMGYGSHKVTVEGAVRKPGVFEFSPGSRLSAAIALAEGPERVARLDQVAVFRDTPGGTMIAKFDYRAVQQGTMIDPVLMPGDRVVMGTSGLSQFWQDVLKSLPAFAVFSYI